VRPRSKERNRAAIPTEKPGLSYAIIFPSMTIVKILLVDLLSKFF